MSSPEDKLLQQLHDEREFAVERLRAVRALVEERERLEETVRNLTDLIDRVTAKGDSGDALFSEMEASLRQKDTQIRSLEFRLRQAEAKIQKLEASAKKGQ